MTSARHSHRWNKTWLRSGYSTIINDATQCAEFIKGHTNDGQPIWNTMALRKWLVCYSKFEELILTKSEGTAGSSSRMTEISCLTFRNTRVRPSRGLFMMGSHLAYLCQYHKGTSTTGKDKMIPHAFDAHTSDMIIQDLAIARPFAQFAAYICYPDNPEVHQLYDSQLFANFAKPFTTTNISTCLQKYTMAFVNRDIGIRDWRHISIAFRRKLSTAIEELIEDDERETVAAAQANHRRSTENRIYGISPEALASGNADDVFPLYLKHSTDWQAVCGVHRGGNLQPYNKCLAKDLPPMTERRFSLKTTPIIEELLDELKPLIKTMIEVTVRETMVC